MVFEKEFISGKEVRERWNIDRQQFFKIIRSASAEIPGNTKWLLRPHSPRNFKEVVFADGWHWRPHREDHGVIKDNYMPPEHESDLEKVTDFLDHYLYLISDVKVIEDRFRLAQRSESEEPSQSAEEYINTALDKKIKNEIIAFELKEHFGWTNLKIARHFKLGEDLQPGQIDALKQRGQRFCEKGKKIKT